MDKPATASGYDATFSTLVRATLLYLATKLGSYLDDLIVVGGMVPSLLIPAESLPEGAEAHVGSRDVDVGLQLAIVSEERYHDFVRHLRGAGFQPDENNGKQTSQRWQLTEKDQKITVDFLIAPTDEKPDGGKLFNIEAGFAAIITPGLQLAFRDRVKVSLQGSTVKSEQAKRDVWCCGPGAFLVLKALAFHNRGENKDAYDLYYVFRYYPGGMAAIAHHFQAIRGEPEAQTAAKILRQDFANLDAVGSKRVAEFLGDPDDETVRADMVGYVDDFFRELEKLEQPSPPE